MSWPGESLLRNMTADERLRYGLPLVFEDLSHVNDEAIQNSYDDAYEIGYDDGRAEGYAEAKRKLIERIKEFEL